MRTVIPGGGASNNLDCDAKIRRAFARRFLAKVRPGFCFLATVSTI
jgi:hypothetical protein